MKLESAATILDFNPFDVRTEAESTHNLGEGIYLADGRCFRYAKVGAANISQGKLQSAPAPKTNHVNLAMANASLGDTKVTVTLGATAATADEYAEGYLCINDVDGEGATYKIAGHPAASASATLELTLFDPLDDDTTASSEATLVHNAYNGVVEAASKTRRPAGVPVENINAGDFGWLQTKGIAAVLAEGPIAVGNSCVPSGSVAGAVTQDTSFTEGVDANRQWDEWPVGRAIIAGVDTEYRPVFLTIE
ncbi:MAG: hypothetical protein QXW38_08370 [Candidatus Nitrosotenuis sp.]